MGELALKPAFDEDVADEGTAATTGALIILSVALWGTMKDGRAARTERMVKALYDHFGLDVVKAGGRCDKCGRGADGAEGR